MKLLKYNNELLANIVPVELLLVVSISVIVLILILTELSDNDEVVRFVSPEPSPTNDPVKLPVMPAVTIKEPVTVELFCAMSPLRAINSFMFF